MRRMAALTFALASAALGQSAPRESGVTFRVYHVGYGIDRLHPLAPDQTPNVDERRDVIDYPRAGDFGGFDDHFVVEVLADLIIETAGDYAFRLTSDDGARLTIDGEQVISHDGLHAATSRDGSCSLAPGSHALRILMFENTGAAALRLEWRPPGASDFSVVPAESLSVEKGVTRVVSPGVKRILDGREPVRPGDGMPLQGVHPGWYIEDLRPQGFDPHVGGMAFLPDGRLLVSSFVPMNNGVLRTEPNGVIWALDNVINGTPATITTEIIAEGFHDPAGLAVVDGDIYVAHRTDITRLRDLDDDGDFETREVFASGWVSDNYHHFTFGLEAFDGDLYGTLSTSIYFDNTVAADNVRGELISMNGPNPANRGTCFRVSLLDGSIEFLAGGFRTPNGVAVGPERSIFVTDNQGAWLPASKLVHMVPGRFYGHRNDTSATSDRYPDGGKPSLYSDRPVSPPAVWLPQNEICNSPTQPILITDGPFAGQMYLAELTMGGVRRVFLERVRGDFQGAIFRHSQGFECGLNRIIRGPDGLLYVGGTGGPGNWRWRGTNTGLQRIRPTTDSAFEYHSIEATPQGFDVHFTRPVDRFWLEDAANYRVTQWHYHPTPEYGGTKRDEMRLVVSRAVASGDCRSVSLSIPGLSEGSVVHIRTDPTSMDGAAMWSTEAWYTLNNIPLERTEASHEIRPLDRPDLKAFDRPHAGWSIAGMAALSIQDAGTLESSAGRGIVVNSGGPNAVDLATAFDHGDIEAHFEFMIPEGSDTGIFFMGRYELQIKDSEGIREPGPLDCGGIMHRRGRGAPTDEAMFGGAGPRVNASRPAGEWQTFDVLFRAPRFDALGKKVANARFTRVVHNGIVIHEDVEVSGPTWGAPIAGEAPFGPLRLEGDGGPVAFRNIRLRPLESR